jgi:hypothetical protein
MGHLASHLAGTLMAAAALETSLPGCGDSSQAAASTVATAASIAVGSHPLGTATDSRTVGQRNSEVSRSGSSLLRHRSLALPKRRQWYVDDLFMGEASGG